MQPNPRVEELPDSDEEKAEIVQLPPPKASIKMVSAISTTKFAIVDIEIILDSHHPTFFYHLYGKQDKLKKNETYSLIRTIESYECEDKEHYQINCLSGRPYWLHLEYVDDKGKKEFICEEIKIEIPPSIPQSPEPVTQMKGGKNALKVKWSIINDNGATILGYILEMKQKEENKFNVIYEGIENNYNCKGLKPGVVYQFRVKAMSNLGCTDYSEISEIKTHSTVTSPPHSLVVENITSNCCNLRWKEPLEFNGEPPQNYVVEISEEEQSFAIVYNGPNLNCNINKLKPNTNYRIRINCKSAAGTSQYSDILAFSTSQSVPGKCSNPILKKNKTIMKNEIDLCWSIDNDEKIDIIGFKLEMKKESGGKNDDFNEIYDGKNQYYHVVDLNPGETYLFRVCAYNNVGKGLYSSISQFTTKSDIPNSVGIIELTSVQPNSISIKWEKPNMNGSELKCYNIYYKHNGDLIDISKNYNVLDESKFNCGEMIEYLFEKGQYKRGIFNYLTDNNNMCYITDFKTKYSIYREESQIKKIKKTNTQKNDIQLQAPKEYTKVLSTKETNATINNLYSGHEYSIYIITENEIGESLPSCLINVRTNSSPPTKPLPPQLLSNTDRSITLKWSDEGIDFHNDKLTEWKLCLDNYSNKQQILYTGTDCEYTVKDLNAGRAYRFILFCKTTNGYSEGSDAVGYCTLACVPPKPNPPILKTNEEDDEKEEYKENSNNYIKLEWSFPMIDNGERIDKNILMMSEDNKKWKEIYSGMETSFEMRNVESGKEYYFQLFSHNAKGKSEGSKIIKYKSNVNVPLSPLCPILSSAPSANSISLQWNKPKDNGSEIQYYIIENDKDDNCCIISNTRYTIEDLKSETNYRFRVYAVNSAGKSKPSEWSDVFRTAEKPPQPPKRLPPVLFDPKLITSNSISIRWSNGGDNDVLGYTVEMSNSAKDYYKEIYKGNNTKMIISDLKPSTTYFFRVSGMNVIGSSKFSNPVAITTLDEPEDLKEVIIPQKVLTKRVKPTKEELLIQEEKRKKAEQIVNRKKINWGNRIATVIGICLFVGYILFVLTSINDPKLNKRNH